MPMIHETRPEFGRERHSDACNTIHASPEETIKRVIDEIDVSEHNAALMCVGGRTAALISARDIIDLLAERPDLESLRIKDIRSSPVVTIGPDEPLDLAYQRLIRKEAASAVLLDRDGKPLEVLSPIRLLQRLDPELAASDEPISQIMRANVIALPADETVQTAIQVMADNRIGNVIVYEENLPPSLFTESDCIHLVNQGLPLTTLLRDAELSPARFVKQTDTRKRVLEIFRDFDQPWLLVVNTKDELVGLVSYYDLFKRQATEGNPHNDVICSICAEGLEPKPDYDRLQYILDISPASIYVLRPTSLETSPFRVTMISPSIKEITGFTPEEWIANKTLWIDNVHPADRAGALHHQARLIDEGTLEHQYRFRHKNGAYRWIHDKLILIRRPDGGIREVIGSWMDITRARETEQALVESEKESRTIFMTVPECIMKLGREGKILTVNQAGLDLLQAYSADQLVGRLYFDMVSPKDRTLLFDLHEQVFNHGSGQLEHQVRGINGRLRWVETQVVPMVDELNQVTACLCISRDVHERRGAEECLRKLSLAVEHNPCAIMITNAEGRIEYVNPKFTAITEYELADIRGHQPNILDSGKIPKETFEDLWQTIRSGKEWHGELLNRKKSGNLFWSKQSIAPVVDEQGQVTHFVSIQEDFSETRKLTEQLNFYARYDPLTRLVNRYEFEQRIGNLLKTTCLTDTTHVLCYLDLDQFKVINDSCGHLAGDELLRQIADLLSRTVRRQDVVARLGGDEFAILMEDCPIHQGCAKAERILEQFRQFRFVWDDCSYGIGVSIGVVPISSKDKKLNDLLKKADAACYSAKEAGRNRVQIFREDDLTLSNRSSEMHRASRIQQNLDNNRFRLYAQRIESLKDDSRCSGHYEVLLRMLDQDDRFIAPGAFLPAAERYDLVNRIDRWVLSHLLDWIVENKHVRDLPILFVNLSGATLGDPDFLDWILNELEKRQLDCNRLGFEITETAAISNLSRAGHLIDALKAKGAVFALDDFGSGLSSFGYLKNLDVDFLKIDGGFVKDILNDPIDFELVTSINQIGHVMGKRTIAEHVENIEIHRKLREIGVDFAQGYAIENPHLLDIADFG
ncbi:MAG: EAL domain-containing protein [Gammaproteobacteria bacterium]